MRRIIGFIAGAFCGALVMLVMLIGIKGLGGSEAESQIISDETQQKLETIQQLIDSNYLYTDEVTDEALQEAAIKGYVDGLGDPYSVYYNEEETRSLFESTEGEFGGIGVVLTQNIDTMLITFTTVYEDAPGGKAGFKSNDILYKVDGEDITGQDLDHVVSKIRGEKGTDVEITVIRGDSGEEYTAKVTRDTIEVTTVSYEMKEGNIGYIAVSGFEKVTYHQFEEALAELTNQGMKGLVIDLRNNPGGNLSTVCEMVDLILPEAVIVYTEDKYGNREVISSDEEKQMDLPMAVLINGNSASASEIFASSLKDYDAAKIVGTTSYGKGIVQQIYTLSDDTALKVTTSEYFTGEGTKIHGIGVVPDIEVEYEYDEANPEADNQLQAAIDCLK